MIFIIFFFFFFQKKFFIGRYSLASNTREDETTFKNVFPSCAMYEDRVVFIKRSKLLKF